MRGAVEGRTRRLVFATMISMNEAKPMVEADQPGMCSGSGSGSDRSHPAPARYRARWAAAPAYPCPSTRPSDLGSEVARIYHLIESFRKPPRILHRCQSCTLLC